MAHAGLNGFQPHEHAGLGLLPGPLQLLLGGAVLRQLPEQGAGSIQRLPLQLGAEGGVHPQQAGVGVVGYIGVSGVAQPPLLPKLLKQPGGDAAPQDGVEQQQLVTAGVQIAEGGEGQDQVVLLCGLSPDGEGGAVAGPLAAGDVAGLQLREDGAQLLHGLGVKLPVRAVTRLPGR